MKYKRGNKYPTEDLIFWQYHHPYHKKTNGEVWLTNIEFERRRINHAKSTGIYKKNYLIIYLVAATISRDKQKYNTSKSDLINIKFIKELIIKQNNKCYWFNVDMDENSSNKLKIRNPLKLTIDRLDCTKGYSKDNVVLCCYAANCGRANCSVEDWIKIVDIIKLGLKNKI